MKKLTMTPIVMDNILMEINHLMSVVAKGPTIQNQKVQNKFLKKNSKLNSNFSKQEEANRAL